MSFMYILHPNHRIMDSDDNERMGIFSASSMLRTVGKLGGPSGRGLLMFRTLAIASTTAAVVGICGAVAAGMLFLIPESALT